VLLRCRGCEAAAINGVSEETGAKNRDSVTRKSTCERSGFFMLERLKMSVQIAVRCTRALFATLGGCV